ncbi:unnamed protein product [Phaedon cochleariae]|uniref:C-type lectin domain-containing protein n=1 Tax=Phaedon cochleariae TaxID=80249 RepID=A0A9P0DN69_PHACE|nr:unnamed protein product [Phaedon cochleariae]
MWICVCLLISTACISYAAGQNDDGAFTSAVLPKKNNNNQLEFAGQKYYFNTVFKANYFGAMAYCKQQGMELLSIESQAENKRIELFLVENGLTYGHFWTSATKSVDNVHWKWLSTGRDIVYTNWYWSEPNNIPIVWEHCIEIRIEGTTGLTWNDLPCSRELLSICEAPKNYCRC